MIAWTNTQSFVEEGENCASTISVEHLEHLFHTIGSDMTLFGYDVTLFGSSMTLFGSYMTLFGSNFNFQEPPVMLVAVLINFGVKIKYLKSLSKLLLGIRC